jgi:hypothetical protein
MMGVLVVKQITSASDAATGSISAECNYMPSTAGVPLCVNNVHHNCITNKDSMVVIMTVIQRGSGQCQHYMYNNESAR